MKWNKDRLIDEYDLPWGGPKSTILLKEICDHTRWSVHYRLIFRIPDQPEGEAYEVYYSVGATESQDESPWEYGDEGGVTRGEQDREVE